jgi:hypothetical protein
MKNEKSIFYMTRLFTATGMAMLSLFFLASCNNNDEPKKEDVPELITKVTLTFTPSGGGDAIMVTATDPDGEGVQNIAMDKPIALAKSTTYVLTINLINGLATQGQAGYDVSSEVETEGDEHQLFFSWTGDAFSDPSGNGNIDGRNDAVNYTGGTNSKDKNNRPLGLTTTWTTPASSVFGSAFRILLKHQPDLKSDTSDSTTGETDLDVTFTLNVQ